jgi:uncharacterized membrane protein
MLTGKGLVGGALLGAGGGALASKNLDLGFDDDFLNELGEKLEPDSSPIVTTVDFVNLDMAAHPLNGRPRQTLGWISPSEKLAEVLQ